MPCTDDGTVLIVKVCGLSGAERVVAIIEYEPVVEPGVKLAEAMPVESVVALEGVIPPPLFSLGVDPNANVTGSPAYGELPS